MSTSRNVLEIQIMSDIKQIQGTMVCIQVVADQVIEQQTECVEVIQSLRAQLAKLEGEQVQAKDRRYDSMSDGTFTANHDAWEEACSVALGLAFAVRATSRMLEKEHIKFRRLQKMGAGCVETLTELREHVEDLQASIVEQVETTRADDN